MRNFNKEKKERKKEKSPDMQQGQFIVPGELVVNLIAGLFLQPLTFPVLTFPQLPSANKNFRDFQKSKPVQTTQQTFNLL